MSVLFKTGVIGTIITAVCCFTPLLVWPLSTLGLAGLAVYLDVVLLPLLAVFLAVTAFAIVRNRGA